MSCHTLLLKSVTGICNSTELRPTHSKYILMLLVLLRLLLVLYNCCLRCLKSPNQLCLATYCMFFFSEGVLG